MEKVIGVLAEKQFGVVSRGQLLELGVSSSAIQRRLASGGLVRVHDGVYRLTGAAPNWHQKLMAALRWLEGESAVSHRAAAALLGMEGFAPGPVEVLTTLRVRMSPADEVIVHNTDLLLPTYLTEVDGLVVTNVSKTLVDLGAVVPPWKVGRALDDALRRGVTNLDDLTGLLDELRAKGRSGVGVLRRLVADRDPRKAVPDSVLEARVFKILTRAGFPEPSRLYKVLDGGVEVAEVDLAYPDRRIAIEVDGYAHHSMKDVFNRDRERQNFLVARGWLVLRVTADDVRRGGRTLIQSLRQLFSLTAGFRQSGIREGVTS